MFFVPDTSPLTIEDYLWLLLLLQVKHFIVDGPLQKPYQYLNKGTYLHPGGIVHSLLHVGGTVVVLLIFWLTERAVGSRPMWVFVAILAGEFLIHYHTDWAKMVLNRHMKWFPINHYQLDEVRRPIYVKGSDYFWILMLFDQLVHALTYIGIVWLLVVST